MPATPVPALRAAVTVLMASLAGSPALAQLSQQSSTPILVDDDPRPLAAALDILRRRYGWVVTYEDLPYAFGEDIADVTASVRRDGVTGNQRRVVGPRGGRLMTELQVDDRQSLEGQRHAIEELLAAYAQHPLPGQFRVVASAKALHVVPAAVRNQAGQQIMVRSILDSRITVPALDTSVAEAVFMVLDQISASSGANVIPGLIPLNRFANTRVTLPSQSASAREILIMILGTGAAKLTWRLFYDPGLRMYVFNVMVVPQPQ